MVALLLKSVSSEGYGHNVHIKLGIKSFVTKKELPKVFTRFVYLTVYNITSIHGSQKFRHPRSVPISHHTAG